MTVCALAPLLFTELAKLHAFSSNEMTSLFILFIAQSHKLHYTSSRIRIRFGTHFVFFHLVEGLTGWRGIYVFIASVV